MVIARTEGELVVIDVLGTDTPLDFLKLFLEAVRGIAEALEHSTDTADIAILTTHTVLVVGVRLTFLLTGHSRHKQLVGISRDRKAVILVDGNHERGTQTEVGGQELTLIVTVKGYL